MNFEGINFPVYRKYKNNKSYFKIAGPQVFEEIKIFGSRYSISLVEAKIYPDRLFISDLVHNLELADLVQEAEYEAIRSKAVAE